jgi:hypothetical protein
MMGRKLYFERRKSFCSGAIRATPVSVLRRHPQQSSIRPGLIFLLLFTLSCFVGHASEVRTERWRWANPLPHGNNVMDMLVTTDLAV